MSPLHRPDIAAYALCALALVLITILAVMHDQIPEVLPAVALLSVGGGAALSTQARGQRATDITTRGGR